MPLEAMLMHKSVSVMAFLMDMMMAEVASMQVLEYQGLKCEISRKEVVHLVKHLVRMPWKERFGLELEMIHC